MLFGSFQESSSKEVTMDPYPTVVLGALVRYCYTDVLDLSLLTNTNAAVNFMSVTTDEKAVLLWKTRDAANYLELFSAYKILTNALGDSFMKDEKDMGCVCALLQVMLATGGKDEPMWGRCLDFVAAYPKACLLPANTDLTNGIQACSLELLEILMELPSMDAFVAVTALKRWHHINADESVLEQVKALAAKIPLDKMQLIELSELKPCDLFPVARCHEAICNRVQQEKTTIPQTRDTRNPSTDAPEKTVMVAVRGAGVEGANGVYCAAGVQKRSIHQGVYANLDCMFELVFKEDHCAWLIQVNVADISSPKIVRLYKATAPSSNTLPLASWTWLRDTEGCVPYAAFLPNQCHNQQPSAIPRGGFNFGDSGFGFGQANPRVFNPYLPPVE